jgi:hypothetical protein
MKRFAEKGSVPYLPPQKVATPSGTFWQNSAMAKMAMMMATPEVLPPSFSLTPLGPRLT